MAKDLNQKLVRYLESIGKSKFILYFESFKNGTFSNDCKESIKSKDLRQKFAQYIFVNNLEFDALELCLQSRVSNVEKDLAVNLIEKFKKDEPLSDDFVKLLKYDAKVEFSGEFLLHLLSGIHKELKKRNMIRGKNLVGDLAEYYVMTYFNKNSNLPNLTMETQSKKGYDLYDKDNHKRYQVKGVTQNQTSNFHLESNVDDMGFDFVVLVKMDEEFLVKEMYLLDAQYFNEVKKPVKGLNTYRIILDKNFKKLSHKLVG